MKHVQPHPLTKQGGVVDQYICLSSIFVKTCIKGDILACQLSSVEASIRIVSVRGGSQQVCY